MTALCKTYYVNPQIGSDTNDGLTPEKPLATLFAVNRLALAPGDTVLLAGKGHETYQILRDGTIHLDEREVVADALKAL